MIENDPVVVPLDARGNPICERCKKGMWLLGIAPAEPGYELRSFNAQHAGMLRN